VPRGSGRSCDEGERACDGRDVALQGSGARQPVGPEQARRNRLSLEAPDLQHQAVRFEQIERDALQVETMLELMRQHSSDGSRILADDSLGDRHSAGSLLVTPGRSSGQFARG
jgi:hypothetical protein